MRWTDLVSDRGISEALAQAGDRSAALDQNSKRRWSEKFANGCAIAFAREFSEIKSLKGKLVLPESLEAGTEPLTPLGSGSSKRIDVTVTDTVLGLEIGLSLKGLNYKDAKSGNYDKNLTGRLYELGDEMRLVHEHLPHAFMAGIFFLPVESVADKTEKAASSFAHAVVKLRERTGRIDSALQAHAARCDASYVALYAAEENPFGIIPGVVRFKDVTDAPPRRGLPKVSSTLSMKEVVDQIVSKATFSLDVEWADPEEDEEKM